MKKEIFMDTAFLIAVIDTSDNYHLRATECYRKLIADRWQVTTSEAVLIETANGLARLKWREFAHKWIKAIQKSRTLFRIVPVTTEIFTRAAELYGIRRDKEWG